MNLAVISFGLCLWKEVDIELKNIFGSKSPKIRQSEKEEK